MRDQLNTLRDHDRADLVLAIVAACQVASLDAGTNEETVERYAGHLKRDAAWARAGLELLRKRGALFPGGGPLRCPHIMAAVRIISGTLKNHVDGSFWQFVDVLRQLARDTIGNPRGLSWLLEDSQVLALAFYRDPSNKATLFAPVVDAILAHCLKASHSIERRDGSHLLSRLVAHRVLTADLLRPHFSIVKSWVEAADGQNAAAIAGVVNNLYNESKDGAAELVARIDPAKVAALLATARPSDTYSWGYLIGRLWMAGKKTWKERLKAALPHDKIVSLISRFTPDEVGGLSELLQNLGAIDLDFGEHCLDCSIDVLRLAYERDPIDAFTETRGAALLLSGPPSFHRQKTLPKGAERLQENSGWASTGNRPRWDLHPAIWHMARLRRIT